MQRTAPSRSADFQSTSICPNRRVEREFSRASQPQRREKREGSVLCLRAFGLFRPFGPFGPFGPFRLFGFAGLRLLVTSHAGGRVWRMNLEDHIGDIIRKAR